MSSMIVMTNYYIKEEYKEELQSIINDLVPVYLAEEGCYQFDLHVNLDDPLHYMSYEQWATPEHFEKHLKSDHVTDAFAKTKEMLTKLTVTKMNKTYDD